LAVRSFVQRRSHDGHAQPLNPAVPYRATLGARLEHIYQDVVVAIDPTRQINNGQPSIHAR